MGLSVNGFPLILQKVHIQKDSSRSKVAMQTLVLVNEAKDLLAEIHMQRCKKFAGLSSTRTAHAVDRFDSALHVLHVNIANIQASC